MSATGYLLWFIAQAVIVVAVLVLGFGRMVHLERKGGGQRRPSRRVADVPAEPTPRS